MKGTTQDSARASHHPFPRRIDGNDADPGIDGKEVAVATKPIADRYGLHTKDVTHRWSGQVLDTIDEIVRQGASKIAAYRNPQGNLDARSAACTHLGCHLHWNSFEVCWHCPCHGSQFAIDGVC
jgi:Rieske Fe-S protein